MEKTNPWMSGNYLPVKSEETIVNPQVTGRVPEALEGRFMTIGMNLLRSTPYEINSYALGDGMVHGVRFRHGKAEWYRNRWVRSPNVAAALGEPARPGSPTPTPVLPDGELAPHTNVVSYGGRTLALIECGLARPYELTFELSTVGPSDFGGTLPEGFTAHPKRDPDTGELHAVSYHPGWGDKVQYTIIGVDGRIRHLLNIPVGGTKLMHDMSITERYAVFYDSPLIFNPELAMAGQLPYQWDPSYGSRVGIMPKEAQSAEEVRWFDVEPCAVYHPYNAYEDGDRVVLDVVRHPRSLVSNEDRVSDGIFDNIGEGSPTFDRWTIDLVSDKVVEERIDDTPQESPRIDERRLGRQHRFGWSSSLAGAGDRYLFGNRVLKYDLVANRTETRTFGATCGASEPMFVPAAPDSAEDDGWVLTWVYDGDRNATDVFILNAGDITGDPAAVVHLPVRVPYTFHVNWLPDA
jgi:carotenoid cleavage dioxygenase